MIPEFITRRTLLSAIPLFILLNIFNKPHLQPNYSLTVKVNGLRNDNGKVVYALYNQKDAFPDEKFEKYYKKLEESISNGNSSAVFKNLTPGEYAIGVLHDENNDGRINKNLIFPTEGIGFSHYKSISIRNQPRFSKACFQLINNKTISINIFYL